MPEKHPHIYPPQIFFTIAAMLCEVTPLLALFRAAFGTIPVRYFSSFLSVFACQIALPDGLFYGRLGRFSSPAARR